ncbi:MAG: hypothetical protein QXE75_04345, partial [Sulfolobales archaeon]
MRYRGTVKIELSRDLAPDDLEDVKKALEEVNRSLTKGFKDPGEGGKIVNWSYIGKTLHLEIESRKLRIDEAAMRIKNSLEESLGSKRKIGIRNVR